MLTSDWDIAAPFMRYSTLTSGAHTTLRLSGFLPLSRVPLSLTVYNELLQYERNFEYFVSGRPYLDGILMHIVPDDANRLAALSGSEVHLSLPSLTMGDSSRLRGTGAKILGGPILNQWTVDFNTQGPPGDDSRVRRAAIMALDRDLIRQKIQGLGGTPGLYMPP